MDRAWWKEAVVYQIYPRSFMDSDGDGIGDLPGILSKADYLKELGVDVVWLSPVYRSPNADNGYDISDYRAIMDDFGTMADWDALLEALHARGIRLVMDLVVNHSSDEHPWFVESRKSKDNAFSDYYIWQDGRRDGDRLVPPNDWTSCFSGSAWKYCGERNQYYLHIFAEKQPDLNWENPALRHEVHDLMRFWLDRGIDGFRMDVINMISKDPGFTTFMNGPRVHEFLQEMNREVLSRYDIMTVGETPGVDPAQAALYVGRDRGELNMVFQFEHMDVDSGRYGKWDIKPWKLTDLKRILGKWQRELDGRGWNSLYLNNHDQPRMVSRFGNDAPEWRRTSAKMLATMIHTLQGTPYIYQGEEIGMTNVKFPHLSDYEDIEIRNFVRESMERGETEDSLLPKIHYRGRDNARTPMQWTAGKEAGFTSGKPWLGTNPNHVSINAEEALADPDSVFHYYRKLIALRHEHPAITYAGDFNEFYADSEEVFAYERTLPGTNGFCGQRLLVLLNFSDVDQGVPEMEDLIARADRLLIGNYPDSGEKKKESEAAAAGRKPSSATILRPYEARVYLTALV